VERSRGEYNYWKSDNWYYIDKRGRETDPWDGLRWYLHL